MTPRAAPKFIDLSTTADHNELAISHEANTAPPMPQFTLRKSDGIQNAAEGIRETTRDALNPLQEALCESTSAPETGSVHAEPGQRECVDREGRDPVTLSCIDRVERNRNNFSVRPSRPDLIDGRLHDGRVAQVAPTTRAQQGDSHWLTGRIHALIAKSSGLCL
jgi:hypothetical protein